MQVYLVSLIKSAYLEIENLNDLVPDDMSVQFDHDKRRILFCQTGLLNLDSALRSYRLILDHDEFDPGYDTIADYRKISEVKLGPGDFREILAQTKKLEVRTGKGALIIGDDTGRLLLARLFCEFNSLFSGTKITWRSFRTVIEAEQWFNSDR